VARLSAMPSNSSHSSPQHGTCDRFNGVSSFPNSLRIKIDEKMKSNQKAI
jgi:hypothetical protein